LKDPSLTRPKLSDVLENPGKTEEYPALFMETNEISYPILSTSVTPYDQKGGWGFLTAGTLQVDKGMKSWGLLG
jgi:hypothetical protein